jgi:hypothetical protein
MSSERVNGKIAKEAGIGVGTLTAIVNESGANRDYYDMYLLGRLQWCEDKKPRTLAILRFPLD